MNLQTKIMTNSDCYKRGLKITPKGIMVHSTATPGLMAAQWFSRWDKSGVKACVHAFLDDKEVWQYLPWNHRGWHGGGSSNSTHISFEICEPAGHTYKPSSAVMYGYDAKKHEAYFRAAWKNAVALCVKLCKEYGLNETNIVSHYEGFRLGIASNSGDVEHWFPKHNESMDTFRAAVRTALQPPKPLTAPPAKGDGNMTQDEFNRMFATAMAEYNRNLFAQPPSGWAKERWDEMCAAGVFDGSAPRSPLTREQAAVVLSRLRAK